MQSIVWIAVAVIIGSTGDATVAHSDDVYKSKAECDAVNVKAVASIREFPGVAAFGVTCAPMVVKKVD